MGPMGPIKSKREKERIRRRARRFFPQHIVEGLLNSRRRVSDRPSWILIFKTPARKSTNIILIVVVVFFFPPEQEAGL